jgi:hypothetical protein
MKAKAKLTILVAVVMLAAISMYAQKPSDLVGTWVGEATVEGEPQPNELTLVLELKDGKLSGKMSDQYGTMNETQVDEISLEEGIFSFSVQAELPGGPIKLAFQMKVTGDSMEGELTIPDMGMSGKWEATRQK